MTNTSYYSLRIAIGNYSDPHSFAQMEKVKIFLHPPGKFVYFTEQDDMPNNLRINLKMRYGHQILF